MPTIKLGDRWHIRDNDIPDLYHGAAPVAAWHLKRLVMVKPYQVTDVPKNIMGAFVIFCWNKEKKKHERV